MGRYDFEGRTELRKAALKRRADARRLYQGGTEHLRGAMYLAGYAVECKLKAVAMEIFGARTLRDLAQRWDVPESDVFSHGLEALVDRLPLSGRFRQSGVWRDFASHVNLWRPSWRYDPRPVRLETAAAFLAAVDRVYQWLDASQA